MNIKLAVNLSGDPDDAGGGAGLIQRAGPLGEVTQGPKQALLVLGDMWPDVGTSTTAGVSVDSAIESAWAAAVTEVVRSYELPPMARTPLPSRMWVLLSSSTVSAIQNHRVPKGTDSSRIRLLQNEIRQRGGLSRDQIAQGIGVSRRSLHAWAVGKASPAADRVRHLELLAEIVRDMATKLPGGVSAAINSDSGGGLLDAVATGRIVAPEQWRLYLAGGTPRVQTTRVRRREQDTGRPPLYAAAFKAYLRGELPQQKRAPTLRPESVYEQDLSRAAEVMGEPPLVRRSGRGYGR